MVSTSDVSHVSWMRKRLGRAALSTKVIGLVSGVYVWGYTFGHIPILLALALGILVFWAAIRLARRLRWGDTLAAKLVAVWGIVFTALDLLDVLPKALKNPNFNLNSLIGMAIFNLPIYFVVRGLWALRTYQNRRTSTSSTVDSLSKNLWEEGKNREIHPVFVNKRSLSLYIFLMLAPLPWICVLLSRISAPAVQLKDQAELIGYQFGSLIYLPMWLLPTVFLYRRARRHALLPATELRKKEHRPIILYLRSFGDDNLKMRARAANGRSWLEWAVKITFEEIVTDHLWRYGPVVAIGRPGDKLPPLGAARDYVAGETWQQKVAQLMEEAALIVVVAGRTEGLRWEIGKIAEMGRTGKLVLLLPPVRTRDELRIRWDTLCGIMGEASNIVLPQDLDLDRTRAVVFPAGRDVHTITADRRDDRTYEAALDAAIELLHDPATRSENAIRPVAHDHTLAIPPHP